MVDIILSAALVCLSIGVIGLYSKVYKLIGCVETLLVTIKSLKEKEVKVNEID